MEFVIGQTKKAKPNKIKFSCLIEHFRIDNKKIRIKLANRFPLMQTGNVINLMIILCHGINAIYRYRIAISFRLSNSIATNYISNCVIPLTHFVSAFRKYIVPKLRMENRCGILCALSKEY